QQRQCQHGQSGQEDYSLYLFDIPLAKELSAELPLTFEPTTLTEGRIVVICMDIDEEQGKGGDHLEQRRMLCVETRIMLLPVAQARRDMRNFVIDRRFLEKSADREHGHEQ